MRRKFVRSLPICEFSGFLLLAGDIQYKGLFPLCFVQYPQSTLSRTTSQSAWSVLSYHADGSVDTQAQQLL